MSAGPEGREVVCLLLEAESATHAEPALAGGRTALYSDRAPEKESGNEDAVAAIGIDARCGVLAVADGMGGRPGGGNASRIALESLAAALDGVTPEEGSLRPAILDGVEQANRRILELGIGAGTTLAVAEIFEDKLRPYHVGDSGILVVGQRGKIKLRSMMHSPVGYAVAAGMLDEDEALHHDERHLVSNIVGSPDMRIEIGSTQRLAARDTVLLATDGVLDNLGLDEIVDRIRSGPLRRGAERLAEDCGRRMREPVEGEPSKPDDCTFALFRRS